jgi:NADPH2:quinone reductase
MTFLTAYIPLTRQVRVDGSTVLVHAAAGGVGSAAVQLAKHMGARVIATASSQEKREFVAELGADETYAYEDFAEQVRADVVLDPVGGDLVAQSLNVLNPLGVHVLIGYAGGFWGDISPALLVGRNVGLQGFYLGRLMRHRPDLVKSATDEIMSLWAEGAVRPVVGATFPLAEAADAHRLIEERRHVGKVVLVP